MDIYKRLFGERLKAARKRLGMTQEALSEAVGVEPPSVSRWETGQDFPSDERLPQICNALNVTPAYFLPGQSLPNDASRALDLFARLSRKGRMVALSQLESLLAFHEEKSRAAR